MFCHVQLGQWNAEAWVWLSVWHTEGRTESHAEFWWWNKKERKKQIGRNLHKWGDNVNVYLKEEEVGIEWTGLIWLRNGTGGWLLRFDLAQEWDRWMTLTVWSGSGMGQVEDSYKLGFERSGCINLEYFLNSLTKIYVLKNDFVLWW